MDTTTKPEGLKFDYGKPKYSLIPHEALDGLARLFTRGGLKYGDRNWELGMNWSRVYDALQRHAGKWFAGEDYDPEDSQHHLLSVIWCAMVLYTYQARKAGTDDRPQGVVIPGDTFWQQAVPEPVS